MLHLALCSTGFITAYLQGMAVPTCLHGKALKYPCKHACIQAYVQKLATCLLEQPGVLPKFRRLDTWTAEVTAVVSK